MSRWVKGGQVGLLATLLAWSAGAPALPAAAGQGARGPWRFGVIADTQWTGPDDGKNPNTCAAGIIRQVNGQLIAQGVRLVVAVGDMVNVGSARSLGTRALYAQDLYRAGIAFYPLRGNHEAAGSPPDLGSGPELRHAFPQIGTGRNNATPADITPALLPAADLARNPPADKVGEPFQAGERFSEPAEVNAANGAVSYSFDYRNARFVLLDQFDSRGSYLDSTIPRQMGWIASRLAGERPEHTFVFAHKNLLGGSHKDNLLGGPVDEGDPGDAPGPDGAGKRAGLDALVSALADGGVRYLVTGHDHHHSDSIVKAPTSAGKSIHQLIGQSGSSKSYTPVGLFSPNEVPITQDLFRIGYYVFTVDGSSVTIDYWGSDATFPEGFSTTPDLHFVKRATFGYDLEGREFLVKQGSPFTAVQDAFGEGEERTSARILSGANGSSETTNTGRPLTRAVSTGWARRECGTASDTLRLWGMEAQLGSGRADVYVLSMSYRADAARFRPLSGKFGIAALGAAGSWVNAVDLDAGGGGRFVRGRWNATCGLGTHGVDPATRTAWAVLDHGGVFRVGSFAASETRSHCAAERKAKGVGKR